MRIPTMMGLAALPVLTTADVGVTPLVVALVPIEKLPKVRESTSDRKPAAAVHRSWATT